MAGHSQHHHQDSSARRRAGSRQTVVRLADVTGQGLAFWSRQRFDIAAELMLRVRRSALPAGLLPSAPLDGPWAMVRAFVIECRAVRKPGGECLFRTSVVLEAALHRSENPISLGIGGAGSPGGMPPIFGLN